MSFNPLLLWLEKYAAKLLPVTLAIPALVLLSLMIQPILTLQFGETVILQTVPVDPTDLFRGDYVDLFYELNQIDTGKTQIEGLVPGNQPEALSGTTVYVVFKKDGAYHSIDHFTTKKPSSKTYLKGTIQYAYFKDYNAPNKSVLCNVDFGIDRYYIQENSGLALEEAARKGKVLVTLKVFNGFGTVRGLTLQQ